MARVMIQLRNDVAVDLHDHLKDPNAKTHKKKETKQLLALAKRLKLRLQPVHPGETHRSLASHFMVEMPNDKTASQVIGQFQRMAGVEAAYFKPEEEPP